MKISKQKHKNCLNLVIKQQSKYIQQDIMKENQNHLYIACKACKDKFVCPISDF